MNTGQKVLGGGIIVALLAYLLWPRFGFSSPATRPTSSIPTAGPAGSGVNRTVGAGAPKILAIRFPYVSPARALVRFDNGQVSLIDSAPFLMAGLPQADVIQLFGNSIISAVERVANGGRVYAEKEGGGLTEATQGWVDHMVRQRRPDLDLRWVGSGFFEYNLDFPL